MPPTPPIALRPPGLLGAIGRIAPACVAALASLAIGPATGVATAQAPGLERFARQPETPSELWNAITYLTRVGRTDQALPLLDRFVESDPDDATLLEIRDRYGVGSILRLEDDPRTAPRVAELLVRINDAAARAARDPARIDRGIALLGGSPVEQGQGLIRLREAGPYAVPALLEAVGSAEPGSPERALLVGNLGRLDRRVVPPLIAALESPDATMAADVASVLGRIGDPRALPALVWSATRDGLVRDEAEAAVRRLAGPRAGALLEAPARLFLTEARRYLDGAYDFPEGQVEVWEWLDGGVAARSVSEAEAEALLGERDARRAAELLPDDREAAALLLTFRVAEYARDPELSPDDLGAELDAAGPEALADALTLALGAGYDDAAVPLAAALGRSSDPSMLAAGGNSPLVAALGSPDRRVQLAAAEAILAIDPPRPFPGSSRVVPILSRSLEVGPAPQVVVASASTATTGLIAAGLASLGYDPIQALSADEAFALAVASAGVEALVVDPSGLRGARDARDLMIDLRADARTAGLPVLLPLPIDPATALARSESYRFFQAEREPNDAPGNASPLAFVGRPRRATVNGRLSPTDRPPYNQQPRDFPTPEPAAPVEGEPAPSPPPVDRSGDLFALGPLRTGDRITATVAPTAGSILEPDDFVLWIERREGPAGVAEARGIGGVSLGVEVPGLYDLRIQADESRHYGFRALYTVDVTLYDSTLATLPVIGTVRLAVEELASGFPHVAVLAAPGDPSALGGALLRAWDEAEVVPLTAEERGSIPLRAAEALAGIAGRPDGPFAPELVRASPSLRLALSSPDLAMPAATALAAVPTVEAQRSLADLALDNSQLIESRRAAAEGLRGSVDRFGPLLARDQGPRLFRAAEREPDRGLSDALRSLVSAMRPAPSRSRPGD